MEVAEAKTGDEIAPGKVLIAPGGQQMKVVKSGSKYTVKCYPGEKSQRPLSLRGRTV